MPPVLPGSGGGTRGADRQRAGFPGSQAWQGGWLVGKQLGRGIQMASFSIPLTEPHPTPNPLINHGAEGQVSSAAPVSHADSWIV
ncbi:unnamed protein product [Arctogadus glacialis]